MAYSYQKYVSSDEVKKARQALEDKQNAAPADYVSQFGTALDETLQAILQRKSFTYDMNADALYKQYRDQYTRQGKLAMLDAVGQASALTGGYGSSYAEQVGQQTYQGYLAQLNDKIPELYKLALSKYQQEGSDLKDRYSLLSERESADYSRYRDSVGDYRAELEYLAGRYDEERDADYDRYIDDRDLDYDLWKNASTLAKAQAEAMLAVGVQPSDTLLQQAGLTREYSDGLLSAYRAALLAAQSGGGSSGGGGGSRKSKDTGSDDEPTLEEQYRAMRSGGASQKQLDNLLNNAVGKEIAGERITRAKATSIRNGR